ncbi:MAG TPA: hypothetical protein VGO00_14715 [Kofleriaceae bacterium]|jgi:hypothetical protein|nr:hypothetical protein [Kofleriaceae bacterium]
MLSIGITARLTALQRMIELFPDQSTITVVDGGHRPVGVIDVASVRSIRRDHPLVVRDVMVALPT